MRRITTMGLCLVAMLATGALAAASASAELPEYKTCVKAAKVGKKYTGDYSDKACSEVNAKGEGKYELGEWNAGKKVAFVGKTVGTTTFDSYAPASEAEPWAGGSIVNTVTCTSGAAKGELIGAKETNETIEFKGCASDGKKCTSEGAKAGTIKTEQIMTKLGYVSAEGPVKPAYLPYVATWWSRPRPIGGLSAGLMWLFLCESIGFRGVGSAVSITSGNINTASKESTQTLTVGGTGGQEFVFGGFGEVGEAHFVTNEIGGVEFPSGIATVLTTKGEAIEIEA